MWGLFLVGGVVLAIALFMDPIGSSPDSGVIDLGPKGTKWVLGGFGGFLIVGGMWIEVRRKLNARK